MTYQALTMGYITISGLDDSIDALSIIDRIENGEGETIFVPERKNTRIVDTRTSLAVSDILRNVVKFGTGQYAHANVRLHSNRITSYNVCYTKLLRLFIASGDMLCLLAMVHRESPLRT